MLDGKVYDICAHYCMVCQGCPLLQICGLTHEKMEGNNLAAKTAWWEALMNEKAKEVVL